MQIRIRHHDGREQCIELDASQTLRLGSHSSADVVLGGPHVHSLHVGILQRNGAFTAVAFKKVGRICVNRRMVQKHVLQEGDQIQAGENLIEVMAAQDAGQRNGLPPEQAKEVEKRRLAEERRAKSGGVTSPREILDELSQLPEQHDLLGDATDEWLSIDEQQQSPDSFLAGPPSRAAPAGRAIPSAAVMPRSRWWNSAWFKTCVVSVTVLPLIVLIGLYVRQLPDARQRFQLAEQFYQREDYPHAIEAYGTFLKHHRDDLRADEAIVKRHLAMLLDSLDRGEEAETLLERTRESIIDWGASRRCGYAQAGLAQLLPPLIADLTRQGRVRALQDADESARESLRQAGEALELVYRYLPPELQNSCGAEQLQLYYTRLQRELNQPAVLRAALSRIEEDADRGGIEAAYAVRSDLLSSYPELVTDGRLLAAMRAVGRAEAERVQPVPVVINATDTSPLQPQWQQVALYKPAAAASGGPPQIVAVALVEYGAVYTVNATTRQVLWRHSVGNGAALAPIRIEQDSLVLFDGLHDELMCVAATSGTTRWRLSLPSPAGLAAVAQRNVIAATRDGLVQGIDVPQGTLTGGCQLPQQLSVGPTIDPVAPRYYQIAEHSLIYVLTLDQSKCLSAYYLGHEQGCVSCAPIVLGEYLLVWEQTGPEHSVVHVLRRGDQLQPVQIMAMSTTIVGAPVVIGDALYVPGSDGQVHVVRYSATDKSRPLQVESAFDPGGSGHRGRVPLQLAVVDGQLWVAGEGVSRYRPAPSGSPPKLLQRQWPDLSVLQLVHMPGGGMVAVGKKSADGPYFFCGVNEADSAVRRQLEFASPPGAPPLPAPGGDGVWVLRSDGMLYYHTVNAAADVGGSTFADRLFEPSDTEEWQTPLVTFAAWCGPVGFFGPLPAANRLAFVTRGTEQFERSLLTYPQRLACPPAVVGRHLVLAARHGPITLYDMRRKQFAAGEFLPDIIDGSLPNWCTPAVLSNTQFVISDGATRLFLLQVRSDGDAVVQAAESDERIAFASSLVFAGNTVWGVSASRELCRVVTPQLTVKRDAQLQATVQWGPALVGNRGFLSTTQGEFYCLGSTPGGDWNIQLEIGPVVGMCSLDDGHVAVASAAGTIAIIDADTGSLIAAPIDSQQRIAFGPFLLSRHLAVLTSDSCLLMMRKTIDELLAAAADRDPRGSGGAEE